MPANRWSAESYGIVAAGGCPQPRSVPPLRLSVEDGPGRHDAARLFGGAGAYGLAACTRDRGRFVRQLLSLVLADEGNETRAAAGGCEAPDVVHEWRPDLVVST